jgi:cation:H+ antiporter
MGAGRVAVFVLAAAVSLGASAILVTRLERIGARLGLTEAMLGVLAALAADTPEISSAVTALVRGERTVGVGVIFGSNAFNLAALLGLSAVIAGAIRFHRRVVLFEGTVALAMAAVSLAVVLGWVSPTAGLVLALAVVVPYLIATGTSLQAFRRLPIPERWSEWLSGTLRDEEAELTPAIHPSRGGTPDVAGAVLSLVVVVAASTVMERTGSEIGNALGMSAMVTGGVLLAAVTSLPNAVAAVYLAARGRGAATLSVALNSNTLNVAAGFLIPAVIVGAFAAAAGTVFAVGWYAGMTALALVLAFAGRGLGRRSGLVLIAAYCVFVVLLVRG